MIVEDELLFASSRAESYKLLSQCYFRPGEVVLNALRSIKNPTSHWEELVNIASNSNDATALEVDYTKLFMGPFGTLAPPYGSIYLENNKQIEGDSTIEVNKMYKEEGIVVSIKEIPDHIAVELEFMYYLITKEISFISSEDNGQLQTMREKQLFFLNHYLCSWIFPFTKVVFENAQTSFYKSLSKLTQAYVDYDHSILKQESVPSISINSRHQLTL